MTPQYIKRTTLLNRRYGWTETSIKKFLPEPDKRTTYHRTGNTGYSYTLERVQSIENTQEFQDWALKHCETPENHKNNKPTKEERKQLKNKEKHKTKNENQHKNKLRSP